MAEPEPEPLDEFHWHEAQDRAWMMCEVFDFLNDHPVVLQTPELTTRAEELLDDLNDFYHLIAKHRHDAFPPKPENPA